MACSSRVVTPSISRAVDVARMPRGIGARVGVNDSVTGSPDAAAQRLLHLRCVLVDAAGLVGAHRAHDLAGEQRRRGRAAGAGRAGRRDDHEVVGLDEAGAQQRRQADGDRGGVAAGVGDARRAGQRGAGSGQLGQAVGPGPRVRRRSSTSSRLRASASRKSAPRSMTGRSAGSWATRAADWPCGRARKTRSACASAAGVGRDEAGVGEGGQLRMDAGDRLPGLGVGRDRAEPQLRDARGSGAAARHPRSHSPRQPPPSYPCA